MRDEKTWLTDLRDRLALVGKIHEKGTHFNSRHRIPRMLRWAHRHASPALKARMVCAQQAHERNRRDEREQNRRDWAQMPAGEGAPKHRWERKPWKKKRAAR